jgi:cytoskeletal protein RodZ
MYKNTKTSRKNKRKLLIIGAISVVFILVVASAYFLFKDDFYNNTDTTQEASSEGPTKEELLTQAESDASKKKELVDTPTPTQTTNTNVSSEIQLEVRQEADKSVTIISKLSNIGSGTCTLSITNGQRSVTKSAEVIYQPEYSTCAGFSIPLSELGGGLWNMKLSVSYSGKILTKEKAFQAN